MTDYTHYFALIGEHWRGGRFSDPSQVDPIPYHVDPLLGQLLSLVAAPATAVEDNMVVVGSTTGARGRVLRVVNTTSFVVESWTHPIYGVPGAAFSPGETVTFTKSDGTTRTGVVTLAQSGLNYPLYGQPALRIQDAELNSFIPTDKSDTPYWDRKAKYARVMTLDHTTGAGGTGGSGVTNLADWQQGDRCTTSGGAAFFILLSSGTGSGGLDRQLSLIAVSGTLTSGHTVTNTRSGATANIGTLGADTTAGTWVPKHIVPNLNGTAFGYEVPPNGNGTNGGPAYIGQDHKLLMRAHEFFSAKPNAADRGVRVIGFNQVDVEGIDGLFGGVTIQIVRCTGTFPTTWITGETVTGPGGWSATVHGYYATGKYLFVKRTNGAILTAGTITGSISASTATTSESAFGYRKGSSHYEALKAEIIAAQSKTGATWMSSPAKFEGMFLSIWECEIHTFGLGAAWPQFSEMTEAWGALITELRELVNNPDMPVAIWRGDHRSRPDISISGYNFAIYLQWVFDAVAKQMPGVRVTRTDSHEPAQTTGLPYSDTMLFHRPLDYLEDGELAWRALSQALIAPSVGEWKILPIIVTIASQSQQVGSIPSSTMMAIDKDPDLWPSATFPGVSTLDPNVLEFNCITEEWEVLDITQNATTFFGMPAGTCGPAISLMMRMKGRFAPSGEYSGLVGHINLAVSASSYNSRAFAGRATYGGAATWDVAPSNLTVNASCSVTVIAATSMTPARGRFTAAVGTFSGWEVGAPSTVSDSLLGYQTMGGNNSLQYYGNAVYAVAADGSYVELVGTFVAETAVFQLMHGPLPITAEADYKLRQAYKKATEMQLIPWPVLQVIEQGESDIGLSSEYKAKAQAILDHFNQFWIRPKGADPIGTVIIQLSANTPIGTDEEVDSIRSIQAELVDEIENAVLIDPSSLPMEMGLTWPRTTRQHNGIHRTARGHVTLGFMIDQAASTLSGIPAHPAGDSAVDFGAVDGGTSTSADTDTLGTDSTLIIEDGSGVDGANAFFDTPYVDAYNDNHDQVAEWAAGSGDDKQKWIRQGTAYIARQYASRWPGVRAYQDQSLPWPRYGVVDSDGYAVSSSSIPTGILEACAEASVKAASGALFLTDEASGSNLQSETLTLDVLTLSSVFVGSKGNQTRFVSIDQILMAAGLINAGLRVRRS